jgi:hypothetical protein
MKGALSAADMSRPDRQPLTHVDNADLMPLPPPLAGSDRPWPPLSEQARGRYEWGLDDTCALNLPQPKTEAEENELVA